MKKLCYLLLVTFAFACSESDETSCSDVSTLAIVGDYKNNTLYTGETTYIAVSKLCAKDEVTVFVNGVAVELASRSETKSNCYDYSKNWKYGISY